MSETFSPPRVQGILTKNIARHLAAEHSKSSVDRSRPRLRTNYVRIFCGTGTPACAAALAGLLPMYSIALLQWRGKSSFDPRSSAHALLNSSVQHHEPQRSTR
jgi:hypothetical protein